MGAPLRSALSTRFGTLQLAVDDEGYLVEVLLPNRNHRLAADGPFSPAAQRTMAAARTQLEEYFAHRRRDFDLPLRPAGSPFERRVWARLCAIPYGTTTSYGAIANELGLVNGARAVGRANGANPIAVVIPCHRVIGSDGTLTGYGGGLPLKTSLLELEGALAPRLAL
ncbi:MAG: methylated-DNA--[protein]-cysteine S-methyltransferase [Candidatus Eremiobacteraeota bacterium]|nr:methylated-DNA--[protein]-cysteine S-methyltransferase [Candidatus Eremiobacteraeota bacterium]MBV8435803.1 methylated-DNA--[protein]-cysteine S-methyltransferase [Candidatus Eremiobacteraeota bacterium]